MSGNSARTLTLEQSGLSQRECLIFSARLYDGDVAALDVLRPGSELEITGLVELEFAPTEIDNEGPRTAPVNFGILLRGGSDVSVLKEPS